MQSVKELFYEANATVQNITEKSARILNETVNKVSTAAPDVSDETYWNGARVAGVSVALFVLIAVLIAGITVWLVHKGSFSTPPFPSDSVSLRVNTQQTIQREDPPHDENYVRDADRHIILEEEDDD